MKILLGSNSPRRKELLQLMGVDFSVVPIDCDEAFPENLPTKKVAEYIAKLKADAYSVLNENEILITADTVVALDNEILGKPKDENGAKEMLQKLSKKTHQVYTAFCIKTKDKTLCFTDVAQVSFMEISDDEIQYYIKNYQPFDKAGSYGVQEWLGMTKIAKIEGSYYTIMGLPTHLLYPILKDMNCF